MLSYVEMGRFSSVPWLPDATEDIPLNRRVFDADGVPMWECNDCGVLISDHMELCALCEREEEERCWT